MDRQRMGLLLVLAMFLAAAIVPNLVAKRSPGAAVIGPVPGPPADGDCLLEPTHDDGWRIADQKPVHSALELGPCTPALLNASCRAVVVKYTGMSDPTDGGRPAIRVRGTHVIREKVFQGLGPPGDATGFATCIVTPTSAGQYLTGPLLGLGVGPVPLS